MNAASTSEPDPSSDSEEGQDFILLEGWNHFCQLNHKKSASRC